MAETTPVLVASHVRYFSQDDERAFFEWLGRLECVDCFRGEVADLFITLKQTPTKNDVRELIALFYRYEIDLKQLVRFETRSNRAWMRNPDAYWHARMFA